MRATLSLVSALFGVLLGLAGANPTARAQLALAVDPLGEAFLTNDGATDQIFDGYQIVSTKGLLSPANWSSIADQVKSNPAHVEGVLGAIALNFGEASPDSKALNELNIMGGATLAPSAQFSVGYPFAQPVDDTSGIKFFYKPVSAPVGIEGAVRFLEPAPGDALRLLTGPDGAAWLENVGSAPVAFDGYQLTDEHGNLNPAGWLSISDYVSAGRGSEVTALLGAGGLGFHEASPGTGNLAELTKSGQGVLQPGAKLDLGHPFQPGEDLSAASFNYRLQGASLSQRGEIVSTPEPATWLLAALGAIACLAMRRRAAR